ncbi:MAG TPA: DNA-formamidopyrimidine glycosylase family protein, partial [Vicinamibacteria bacterium]|nr:DNA-formamidopyrimidine glycosylase family protein [Vicinamibacteria bacterium]
MPELPEVESARRRAERALAGRRILGVATRPDPLVFAGTTPRRFARALVGRRVEAVRRKGKHLWMELDGRPWPLFHFGMSGSFEIYRDPRGRPRFWKLELATEDGTRLAMADTRRFGRIRLRQDPEREPPVAELGFDPLLGLPPARLIARALARRRAPIKSVLLDQGLF